MPPSTPPARLPNAPLAEAVFEARWALVGNPTQPIFQTDPGVIPLVSRFTDGARELGFGVFQDMAQPHEVGGAAVLRRFYRANGQPFPLLQIGSGVFAANQSSDYFWPEFKNHSLAGMGLLIESYPKFEDYPLSINQLELRYVDVFDTSLVNTKDLIEFVNKVTSWPVGLPSFVEDRKHDFGDIDGRIQLSSKIKSLDNSTFVFDLAKGVRETETVFRLEIKILQTLNPPARASKILLKKIDKWLEEAHEITSPFFKSLIQPEVMKKFGG